MSSFTRSQLEHFGRLCVDGSVADWMKSEFWDEDWGLIYEAESTCGFVVEETIYNNEERPFEPTVKHITDRHPTPEAACRAACLRQPFTQQEPATDGEEDGK